MGKVPRIDYSPDLNAIRRFRRAPHRVVVIDGVSYRCWDVNQLTKRFNQPDPERGHRSSNHRD